MVGSLSAVSLVSEARRARAICSAQKSRWIAELTFFPCSQIRRINHHADCFRQTSSYAQ